MSGEAGKLSIEEIFSFAHGVLGRAVARGDMRLVADNAKAGLLYDTPRLLPQALRVAQARRRTWGSCFLIAAPLSLIWWPWWASMGLLLYAGMIMLSAQRAAGAAVIQAALDDVGVLKAAIARGALRIEPVTRLPATPPAAP